MIIKNNLICFDKPLIPLENKLLSEDKIYYVYVLLNPNNPKIYMYEDFVFPCQPFYIGKGKNDRLNFHTKEAINTTKNSHKLNTIRKILKNGNNPLCCRISEYMTEEEALFLEENIIYYLKTMYNCLTNIHPGGTGGDYITRHYDKKSISQKITEGNLKSYRDNPERAKNQGKKIKGSKNGRWKKGHLTSGEKNGKYIKINEKELTELYFLGFSTKQIGKFFNVSSIIPKHRLRALDLIKGCGKRSKQKDFNFRENLIELFKKGEIKYEELIERAKRFNTECVSFL